MRNQPPSPFLAIDKWMEVLRSPDKPRWLKISGVPMHAWREGIFLLIVDCVGSTWRLTYAQALRKSLLMEG